MSISPTLYTIAAFVFASIFIAISSPLIVINEDVWALQIHCPTNIIELYQTADIVIEGTESAI